MSEFRAEPISWSVDGETLAFRGLREGQWDVGFLAPGDSTPRWFLDSESNETQLQWSPDGRWVAYTSDRSGQLEIYVESSEGGGARTQVSTGGATSPRWAPDKDVLYYVPDPGTVVAAAFSAQDRFRITSRTDAFRGVQEVNFMTGVNWDVHPNGEEFVHIMAGSAESSLGLVWILNWPEMVREMTGGGG